MRTVIPADIQSESFHLAILICGYETRASHVAQHVPFKAERHLILDYLSTGLFNYDKNKVFYENIPNVQLLEIDESLSNNLKVALQEVCAGADPDVQVRILIDISSCSRSVMAKILLAITENLPNRADVSCTYALSKFEVPPDGELPSHISQPVIGDLSGWSDDLSKPPCAIIGLGFEPGRALGCMDYLEIPEVRLFMPVGVDTRFETAVREANAVLISEVGRLAVLPYSVLDPAATYEKMESLIHGLLPSFRPVIIPLGPKIFAALAMVLALRTLPRICVWRTSSGGVGDVSDSQASGEVAIFRTQL